MVAVGLAPAHCDPSHKLAPFEGLREFALEPHREDDEPKMMRAMKIAPATASPRPLEPDILSPSDRDMSNSLERQAAVRPYHGQIAARLIAGLESLYSVDLRTSARSRP
jgi:hypothetical protein